MHSADNEVQSEASFPRKTPTSLTVLRYGSEAFNKSGSGLGNSANHLLFLDASPSFSRISLPNILNAISKVDEFGKSLTLVTCVGSGRSHMQNI